jgi:hypothetical protein
MFAYDMLRTAPYNLSWQTHFLNLVHTPRKAVSAVIAGEAMRRLPRLQSYGRYPDNLAFGDFRVSYADDLAELNAEDAFMNAGVTTSAPRNPRALKRIVGLGASPLVGYEGTGAYFLDKIRDGLWRLEVYPDAALVGDPFEQPRPDRVVSRLLYRSWPMTLHLPDLGGGFFVRPITVTADPSAAVRKSADGTFAVEPGVWLLSRRENIDRHTLPARINRVAFDEYHVNEIVSYPDLVQSLAPKEFAAEGPIEIGVRVANTVLPDQVELWIRAAGMRSFDKPVSMHRTRANDYAAVLGTGSLAPGLYEYAVSTRTGARVTTFPGAEAQRPADWPFRAEALWSFRITPAGTPVRLLDPKEDYARLSFVRPGEQYRTPFFQIAPGESADESALSLSVPDLGKDTPARYAAALFIGDALAPRKQDLAGADGLDIKLRAVGGAKKTLLLTLIEQDGAAWSTPVVARATWSTVTVPLDRLTISRSIHIPSPYPGLWNYWRESPARRGVQGEHIRVSNVERLQLTVSPNTGDTASDDATGAAVESIRLTFAGRR